MKVSGQLYNPTTLTVGKVIQTYTEQKVGWAPDFVWIWWQGEKYQTWPGVYSCGHTTHFLSTITTELSRLKVHEDTTQMEL